MFEAVKFPASVSDLNTGLTDVNRDALPHGRWWIDLRRLKLKNVDLIWLRKTLRIKRRLSRRLQMQIDAFRKPRVSVFIAGDMGELEANHG